MAPVNLFDVAVIGGTGIGSRLLALPGEDATIPTERGEVSARLLRREGARVAVLSRHAAGHRVPPHRVPYGAIALAMKAAGARAVFATAAVGSLRSDRLPGDLILLDDFLDFSGRQVTLFDREIGHTDFSAPFDPGARGALVVEARARGLAIHEVGTYLNLDGPRYETPAEVRLFGSWGCDVVGMTAGSEAIVMREAAVPYACLAVVTNLGTGLSSGPLSHAEVGDVMESRGEAIVALLLAAADRLVA